MNAEQELVAVSQFAFNAARACLAVSFGADPQAPGREWAEASEVLCNMIDQMQKQLPNRSEVLESVRDAYASTAEPEAPSPVLYVVLEDPPDR